jgi:hypothetical protein
MEQSPSWEPNRYSVTQVIPRINWNTNVHYRIYKRLLPVRILNQISPVHAPVPPLEDPSRPRYIKLSISIRSSHHTPVWTSPNTTAYHFYYCICTKCKFIIIVQLVYYSTARFLTQVVISYLKIIPFVNRIRPKGRFGVNGKKHGTVINELI